MRVVFWVNHAYKVWHTAAIAFELSQRDDVAEVIFLCNDAAILAVARSVAATYPENRCQLELASIPPLIRGMESILGGLFSPVNKAAFFCNHRRLATFDAIVSPDPGCSTHRARLPGCRMIYTHHGAGDRAMADDPNISRFDLVLASGSKLARRYRAENGLDEDHCALVGYVKFETVDRVLPSVTPIFSNGLPTVLFNPHFEPRFSCWKDWGIQVLEFFANHPDRYNLIFAPHLKLFKRWLHKGGWLPPRFRHYANIHVDTGSPASENMTYTRLADIYLGDVSSQVYEFLRQPRPCLFLDPRGIEWQRDHHYAHWHLGPVLRDISSLGPALDGAMQEHVHYRPKQERAFADTFDLTSVPSSRRAAQAIHDYMLRHRDAVEPALRALP